MKKCAVIGSINMDMVLSVSRFPAAGETLSGRAALEDTMKDLIVDACAAAAMSLMGYLRIRKGQKRQSP